MHMYLLVLKSSKVHLSIYLDLDT